MPPHPPPPTPPPPPTEAQRVTHLLNQRFRNGRPDNSLSRAGVLVHQFGFEYYDDRHEPWRMRRDRAGRGARSAMLILNGQRPDPDGSGKIGVFRQNRGGYILRPDALRLKCSYPTDGETQDSPCSWGHWCPASQTWYNLYAKRCAYPPERLDGMLQMYMRLHQHTFDFNNHRGYNELVFDDSTWQRNLPRTIEAFFYLTNPACDPRWCRSDAIQAHRAYNLKYGTNVPLLTFNLSNWVEPFRPARPPTNCEQLLDAWDVDWATPSEACGAWRRNPEWRPTSSLTEACSEAWPRQNCARTCCLHLQSSP